ncbi:hypothetical protein ASF61_17085 [Duganella sp. Leaf126]|nr:hypothetical protein ASF61_17085 [Duganella sp. Leaf126]
MQQPRSTVRARGWTGLGTGVRARLHWLALVGAACCSNALAVEVVYQGPPGSSGLAGATPGAPGSAGSAAPPATYGLFGADPTNLLVVQGGAGGKGGNGANGMTGQTGGAAGAGGAGARASAQLSVTAPATGGSLAVTADGGAGGNAGQPGSGAATGAGAAGGAGGAAFASGVLISHAGSNGDGNGGGSGSGGSDGSGNGNSDVIGSGGGGRNGGNGSSGRGSGGHGGSHVSSSAGSGKGSSSSNASGKGSSSSDRSGKGGSYGSGSGASGKNGAAVVDGVAQARGGQGGRSTGVQNGADGGAALSNLTMIATGRSAAQVRSLATGGRGADATGDGTMGGRGGDALATAGIGNPNATLSAYRQAVHATGGAGGHANLDAENARYAYGGRGGDAAATTSSAANTRSTTLVLVQSATGGAGGDTVFGFAGRGGNASSTISKGLDGALAVNVASTATGGAGGSGAGNPFTDPLSGTPGAGGDADSTVSLGMPLTGTAPGAGSWNAVIAASSTAQAGRPGTGAFSGPGGSADASVTVAGYGRVSGTALATGGYGGDQGGGATARATVASNYSAAARATANGGGAFFNPGAPAVARADATSAWHASADAVAMSGSGRFGNTEPASAVAQASVSRAPAAPLPPPTMARLAPEARAHAQASFRGGEVLARSSYRDTSRDASVVATAGTAQPANGYQPEAYSAANIGGPAYGPWTPDATVGMVASYASALPNRASLAPLLTASPAIAAAFADAQLLGAGTMGALFFPFTGTAQFGVPFTAGRHLLLGLGLPFRSDYDTANFTFSVSNGATELVAGSFTTPGEAALFFSDRVIDLGVFDGSTLDLLVRFSFNGGIYGFSYVLGAGDALTAVPEPGAWLSLLLGLALGALVLARRSGMVAVSPARV